MQYISAGRWWTAQLRHPLASLALWLPLLCLLLPQSAPRAQERGCESYNDNQLSLFQGGTQRGDLAMDCGESLLCMSWSNELRLVNASSLNLYSSNTLDARITFLAAADHQVFVAFDDDPTVAAFDRQETQFVQTNEITLSEPAAGLAVLGETLYVAVGTTLRAFDIAGNNAPQPLSETTLPMQLGSLTAADNNRLFSLGADLVAWNVADPTSPELLWQSPGFPRASIDSQGIAYAAVPPHLEIYDLTGASGPALVSRTPGLAHGNTVAFRSGTHLFIGRSLLQLFDVAELEDPIFLLNHDDDVRLIGATPEAGCLAETWRYGRLVVTRLLPFGRSPIRGQVPTEGLALRLDADSHVAFVASELAGLEVLSFQDPEVPALDATLKLGDRVLDADIAGQFGAAAYTERTGESAVAILDLASPAHPARVGVAATPGEATSVECFGTVAAIADGLAGLTLIDFANPLQPQVAANLALPGFACTVDFDGQRAIVGAAEGGFHVVDALDFGNLRLTGTLPVVATEVLLQGDHAYVAHRQGLTIASVAGDSPTVVAEIPSTQTPSGLTIDRHLLYISHASGFDVIDVSVPSQPRPGRRAVIDAGAVDIDAAEETLVVANYTEGVSFHFFACPEDHACLHDGDLNGDGRLTPIDARCALDWYLGVADQGHCNDRGTCSREVADVNCDGRLTPRDALHIFRRWQAGGAPEDCFAAADGTRHPADEPTAAWVGAILGSQPAPPALAPQITPQPTRGPVVLVLSEDNPAVEVGLYDATGRIVRTWSDPQPLTRLDWDGASTNGQPVAPGVYFMRVVTLHAATTHKIVVVR